MVNLELFDQPPRGSFGSLGAGNRLAISAPASGAKRQKITVESAEIAATARKAGGKSAA
jgi:hypothetical protein